MSEGQFEDFTSKPDASPKYTEFQVDHDHPVWDQHPWWVNQSKRVPGVRRPPMSPEARRAKAELIIRLQQQAKR